MDKGCFEYRKTEFYKLLTMVTRDDDSQNIYTVSIGQYNELTSYDESKYEDKCKNVLIVPGEYISKKLPIKIPENKKMHLYIVLGASTLLYQQDNNNPCILSYLT